MGKTYFDDTNALDRTPDFSLTRDKTGLWTGMQVFTCARAELLEVLPARRAVHPLFDWVYEDGTTVSGLEDDTLCRVEVRYAGAAYVGEDNEEEANPPEYTLEVSVSEEPLETHPRYVDALTEEDIREAVELAKNPPREDDGTLSTVSQTGWAALKSELYDYLLQGFENYRDPKATWTKRWVSDARPTDLNEVGKIQTPDGSPPAVASGRNWINAGLRSTERGVVFENEQVWELSGRGGWDTNIYT